MITQAEAVRILAKIQCNTAAITESEWRQLRAFAASPAETPDSSAEVVAAYAALDKCKGFALQGIHEKGCGYCQETRSMCLDVLELPIAPRYPGFPQEADLKPASGWVCSRCGLQFATLALGQIHMPECKGKPAPESKGAVTECEEHEWLDGRCKKCREHWHCTCREGQQCGLCKPAPCGEEGASR